MSNIFKIITLVLVISIFISSCGTLNVKETYSLEGKSDVGLVIVSLTQSGYYMDNYWHKYRSMDYSIDKKLPATNLMINNDWKPTGGDKDNKLTGRLAVFELPSGEYEIYAWFGNRSLSFSSLHLKSVISYSYKFRVYPSKAVYLGNIDLYIDPKCIASSLCITNKYMIIINDKQKRDLQLFHSKYLHINFEKVIVNILKENEKNLSNMPQIDLNEDSNIKDEKLKLKTFQ